jgi:hypothetical protein
MLQAAFADGAFFVSGDRARMVCDREAANRGLDLSAGAELATAS